MAFAWTVMAAPISLFINEDSMIWFHWPVQTALNLHTKNNTNLDSMSLPPQRNCGGEPAQTRTDDKYTQGRRCRFGHD
jgi:hypothetical protein